MSRVDGVKCQAVLCYLLLVNIANEEHQESSLKARQSLDSLQPEEDLCNVPLLYVRHERRLLLRHPRVLQCLITGQALFNVWLDKGLNELLSIP